MIKQSRFHIFKRTESGIGNPYAQSYLVLVIDGIEHQFDAGDTNVLIELLNTGNESLGWARNYKELDVTDDYHRIDGAIGNF